MEMVREILGGNETYPKAAEAYLGIWKEGTFLPFFYLGQWRQNAHHSRQPFQSETIWNTGEVIPGWVDSLPTAINVVGLPETVTVTAEEMINVVGSRYRQKMTREREQAQSVLAYAGTLAGTWHTVDLVSALVKVACTDYDPRKPGKLALSDPWKYRHIYRAICNLLASK